MSEGRLTLHSGILVKRRRGWTLVELIGVLAIIAILSFVVAANVIERIKAARREAERENLKRIAELLIESVLRAHVLPSSTGWIDLVASNTDLSAPQIAANKLGLARVLIPDPTMVVGAAQGGGLPLPYVQASEGSVRPKNVRYVLISSTWQPLPEMSSSLFQELWNLVDGSVPSSWPAEWQGHGSDLHIQKIDLTPLFCRFVVNNLDPAQSAQWRVEVAEPVSVAPKQIKETWYLKQTAVDLFGTNGVITVRLHLSDDISLNFAYGHWSQEARRPPLTAQGEFASLVQLVLNFNPPPDPNKFGTTVRDILSQFYTFMWYYTVWAGEGFYSPPTTSGEQLPMYRVLEEAQRLLDAFTFNILK